MNRTIDASALIAALTGQRNAALDELAQLTALLAVADARVAELERELGALRVAPMD
jgi:hypothetical protein